MMRQATLASFVLLALAAACTNPYSGADGAATGAPARDAAPLGSLLPNASPLSGLGYGERIDELVILERLDGAMGGVGAGQTQENFNGYEDPWNPGTGEMRVGYEPMKGAVPPSHGVALPLERTDVRIDVLGPVATGRVRQRFTNPFTRPIEAVYVFPLPHDAAIHDFLLTVGDRRIRGIVREREEAQRIYEAARAQGYTAALLDQHRPNVFEQKVANLLPGKPIDVELAYLEPVDLVDGWQELTFPMVVGPRYNPADWDEGIGAVAPGTSSGQPVDVPYERPGTRSGHDISLTVDLRAGLGVERISSPTHAVTVDERPEGALVELSPAQAIPNADFRLRWRTGGEGLRAGLLQQGDHALLTLYPPEDLADLPRRPLEHVFVLDTSGSMNGEPLALLKRAMRAALDQLDARDSFHVLHFSNSTGALADRPLLATADNKRRARRWLDDLRSGGGTELLQALQAALGRPSDGERPRVVTFFTDGYIGNEEQILAAIQERTADARIFAFGIGASPNRWLMAEMARRSGGAEAYVGLDEDPRPAIDGFFRRASRPAVDDLRLTWTGATGTCAIEVPERILIGRPVSLPFELTRTSGPVSVRVDGRVDGGWRELASTTGTRADDVADGVLGKVWARGRLSQLAADARIAQASEREAYGAQMCAVALRYGLVSNYTSFIAVDSAAPVTDGGDPARVDVPVAVPAGVEYETTVGN